MKKEEKIEKIESLELSEFASLLMKVIENLGYLEVKKLDENLIAAKLNNPLGVEKQLFFMFPFKLDTSKNLDNVKKVLLDKHQLYSVNTLFIVSTNHISNGFEKSLNKEQFSFRCNIIGRDRLIALLDEHYPDFWKHSDRILIDYEKSFVEKTTQETEFRKLKIPNEKCQQVLDIYIEPRLSYFYEEKKTRTPIHKRVSSDDIVGESRSVILSGVAGSGKSTFLKKIGYSVIENNAKKDNPQRNIPIYLVSKDIYDNNYKLINCIKKEILANFSENIEEVARNYQIHLLIDSIDEFDDNIQKELIKQIQDLEKQFNIKSYIGTRSGENIKTLFEDDKVKVFTIERFNSDQIKRFVSSFFSGSEEKAKNLMDALRENKIIDKLPITPLTLSLISILYEENDFEIPATITDIYDNFNTLIIGKSIISSKIELIDISFKERILSLYALKILKTPEHKPLTKSEFLNYFLEYYKGRTLPIKVGSLEDVLEYLINNTGVLFLKDKSWVQFSHDSYMEYYAALEIFKHQRVQEEPSLVTNFFDPHWQNVAVFYAGKSKDMPDFLAKIIGELKKAEQINDLLSGVIGAGYLLQALYQTDNQIRKNVVLECLELTVKANDVFKKLSSDNINLFRNYRMPILQLMNVFYFYECFNSITLKEPLKLSFSELITLYNNNNDATIGYKLIQLAFTLDSKRINESKALEEILDSNVYADPSLYALTNLAVELLGKEKYKSYKQELKKKYHGITEVAKKISTIPAAKLRFTNLDTISADKPVKIIVEGQSDALIIEHAYYILTNGHHPYWKISVSGNNGETGSCRDVAKALSSSYPIINQTDTVIGLFDHDSAGLREFFGLSKIDFELVKNNTIKKHIKANIYGVCLPVPGEMEAYIQKNQDFNFFAIEHYLGHDFLQKKGVLKETPIVGVYGIYENKKKGLINEITNSTDPDIFKYFIDLFKVIDSITGVEIDYIF